MPSRLSRWIRLALAVAAVGVAVCALLELTLRLSVGDLYATLYQPDPDVLYRLAPGATKTFQRPAADGGARIRIAVNPDGFRGEPLERPGAAARVLLYGDSFVAAEFSALDDTFGERLEARLSRDLAEPVEVVNAGVVGYGPDQALLRMREEIPALRPDLVVLAIYAGNDFGDLLRNKLFALSPDGALLKTHAHLESRLALRLRFSRYTPVLYKVVARAYYSWTHRGSHDEDPAEASARRIELWLAERQAEWQSAHSGDLLVINLQRDTPDLDVAGSPLGPAAQYKTALMEGVLAAVRDAAAQSDVPLLLVLIPSPMDACLNHPMGRLDPADFPAYHAAGPTTRLSEMADRLSIAKLDLFPHFRSDEDCDLFFPDDGHWNDSGQEQAAQRTADAIATHGLLERRPKTGGGGGSAGR